jgi:CHAT domain-containing protein
LTKKRDWLTGLSKRLGKKVALLQYGVLPDTVEVILTTSTGWHGTSAPTGPLLGSTLDMDISDMQVALRDPKSEASAAGQRLYRRLVAPVEAWLKAEKITAIVLDLDGQLQYLPFAALHDGNRWLTERFILGRYSGPSVAEQQENRTWKIAGFGVSKPFGDFAALPGVKAELERIIRRDGDGLIGVFPGTIHLDDSFTERQLFAEIETGVSVLHIASHFRLSPGSDADSALLMGAGKMLSLREIRSSGLDLNRVDLVVGRSRFAEKAVRCAS